MPFQYVCSLPYNCMSKNHRKRLGHYNCIYLLRYICHYPGVYIVDINIVGLYSRRTVYVSYFRVISHTNTSFIACPILCMYVDVGKFSKGLDITADDENVTVYYELKHGAECLLKDGYLQSQICYKSFTKEAVCSSALVNDLDANCLRIDTEKGNITLPRYYKYCIAADISGLSRDSLSRVISANEDIPIGKPRHLAVELRDQIMAKWVAPPFVEWRGIPKSFSVNVSVDDSLVNSTSILVQSLDDYEISFPISEEGDSYTVAVSSCTSVGCGPRAEETSECTLENVLHITVCTWTQYFPYVLQMGGTDLTHCFSSPMCTLDTRLMQTWSIYTLS